MSRYSTFAKRRPKPSIECSGRWINLQALALAAALAAGAFVFAAGTTGPVDDEAAPEPLGGIASPPPCSSSCRATMSCIARGSSKPSHESIQPFCKAIHATPKSFMSASSRSNAIDSKTPIHFPGETFMPFFANGRAVGNCLMNCTRACASVSDGDCHPFRLQIEGQTRNKNGLFSCKDSDKSKPVSHNCWKFPDFLNGPNTQFLWKIASSATSHTPAR